jgi:hypothetical protein
MSHVMAYDSFDLVILFYLVAYLIALFTKYTDWVDSVMRYVTCCWDGYICCSLLPVEHCLSVEDGSHTFDG